MGSSNGTTSQWNSFEGIFHRQIAPASTKFNGITFCWHNFVLQFSPPPRRGVSTLHNSSFLSSIRRRERTTLCYNSPHPPRRGVCTLHSSSFLSSIHRRERKAS